MTDQEILTRLEAMERRLEAMEKRKADSKQEVASPFLRRGEAMQLLKTRTILEACERAGWLPVCVRKPRLVLYKREDVLACVFRLAEGEYP
jgi:hypothetical protein